MSSRMKVFNRIIIFFAAVMVCIVLTSCEDGRLFVDPMHYGDYGVDSITSTQIRIYWHAERPTKSIIGGASTQFRYGDKNQPATGTYTPIVGSYNSDSGSFNTIENFITNESWYLSGNNTTIQKLGNSGQAIEYSGLLDGPGLSQFNTLTGHYVGIQDLNQVKYSSGETFTLIGLNPNTWYMLQIEFWLGGADGGGITGTKYLVFKTLPQ